MKQMILLLPVLFLFETSWAQRPTTQVNVSRPTTAVSISRPQTDVSVQRPVTSSGVYRPATQVSVSRPVTQVNISKPVTQVEVSRPVTEAGVSRPATSSAPAAGSVSSAKKSAPEPAPSTAAKTTSMSGYKPPVAKDFKAPTAGNGDQGLGNKVNQAEKDAAAAATQAPKLATSNDLDGKNLFEASSEKKVGGSSLLDLLKEKAAGRSAPKK